MEFTEDQVLTLWLTMAGYKAIGSTNNDEVTAPISPAVCVALSSMLGDKCPVGLHRFGSYKADTLHAIADFFRACADTLTIDEVKTELKQQ